MFHFHIKGTIHCAFGTESFKKSRINQFLAFRNIQDKQAQELGNNSADSYEEEMKKLVIDGNLTEKQKKEILNEYMMDLKRLNRQHEKGIDN